MADIRSDLPLRFAEALTLVAFRIAPTVRRAWLLATIRVYHGVYTYANFVAGHYLGLSPKLAFDWGMQSFFLPRIAPGARVLDVGCGRGHLAERLAGRASIVIGYDHDLATLQTARQRRPSNLFYYCGDAIDALPRAAFDVAILSSVLPFVSDAQRLLRELVRIVPELLIRETRYDRDFTVLLLRSLGGSYRSDPQVRREYTKQDLVDELEMAGWRVVEAIDTYDMFVRAVRQ